MQQKREDLISSVDPPRNATGRKKGYIEVMTDRFMGVLGLRILGAKKPEFTGSSIKIVENGARAELYTKY